jgi:hypothetical protein
MRITGQNYEYKYTMMTSIVVTNAVNIPILVASGACQGYGPLAG